MKVQAAKGTSVTELVESEGVSVKRWRRFRMDRLYVNAGDGTRIGWVDLISNEKVIEQPALSQVFEDALRDWRTKGEQVASTSHLQVVRGPEEVVDREGHCVEQVPDAGAVGHDETACRTDVSSTRAVEVEGEEVEAEGEEVARWVDLSQTTAGAAARAQAVSRRHERPVSSFLARLVGLNTRERAWRMGEKGEALVARELALLGHAWHVLHAIPVGLEGSDIDHVVIGPPGVFALNAKHHKNAAIWVGGDVFMVNGHREPYVRNSRHEAQRAGKLLAKAYRSAVAVTGVIVPVNAGSFTVREQPKDVHVVNRARLVRWLRTLPPALNQIEVEGLFELARRSSTWHPM